jgi:ABC-type transport auxiliary lipoprotein component
MRFYKNTSLFVFLSLVACLFSSCILSPKPFRSVKYHDLGMPSIINKKGPFVEFLRFAMNGPYKNKMVFRAENNQLVIDEYNKWAQTPETMLGRYMALAFRGKSESDNVKTYSVTATLMAFEADESTENAVLIIEYTIVEPFQGRKKSFSRTFTTKMKAMSPNDFANAMVEIAANLAKQLKIDMLGMK